MNPVINPKLYIRYAIAIIILILTSVFYGYVFPDQLQNEPDPVAANRTQHSGDELISPAASCCIAPFSRGKMLTEKTSLQKGSP